MHKLVMDYFRFYLTWNVTLLAFLKKESGRQISVSHSTGSRRYSDVMLSGSRNLDKYLSINQMNNRSVNQLSAQPINYLI